MVSAPGDVWEAPFGGSPGEVVLEGDPGVDPEPDRGIIYLIWSEIDWDGWMAFCRVTYAKHHNLIVFDTDPGAAQSQCVSCYPQCTTAAA